MNKERLSARINPYNFDMLRLVADTLFYSESKNKGNLSEALDWILTVFKHNTQYRGLIKFLEHYGKYQRGSRTKEDLEAVRNLMVYLKYKELMETPVQDLS